MCFDIVFKLNVIIIISLKPGNSIDYLAKMSIIVMHLDWLYYAMCIADDSIKIDMALKVNIKAVTRLTKYL